MSAGDKRRMGLKYPRPCINSAGAFFAPSPRPASLAAICLPSRGLAPAGRGERRSKRARYFALAAGSGCAPAFSPVFPMRVTPRPLCNNQQAAALAREIIKTGCRSREERGIHHQCVKEGAAAQRSHAAKRAS